MGNKQPNNVLCCIINNYQQPIKEIDDNKDIDRKKLVVKTNPMPMFKCYSTIASEDIYNYYVFKSKIGEGYFSKVKLGYKISEGESSQYAIKIISKSKVDITLHKDFLNELSILKNLDHPYIIKLYEVYSDKYNYYLVMELLTGGDVFSRINSEKLLSEKFISQILYKLISAINYCHAIGICHRDIKPENILFVSKKSKDIKVIDFGLSKKFLDFNQNMNSFLGTPYFVAPEVIKENYNINCDMWSIGATAYMLFTGKPPFPEKSREVVLKQILENEPDYNDEIWKKWSPEAKDLIKLLLNKNPNHRLDPEEALKHDFFKKVNEETHQEENIDKDILKNITRYDVKSRFTKLILSIITKSLTHDELSNFTKTFNAIDINQEGLICIKELKIALSNAGLNLTDSDIDKLMEKVDSDGNGILTYSEFLAAALNKKKAFSDEKLRFIFCALDYDSSGFITANHLYTHFVRIGRKIIDFDEISNMIKEVSTEEKLSFESFKNILNTY